MELGLTGRTAMVLGAGGGLGGAIACSLAREGAHIALVDIDKDALERTRASLDGARSISVLWDLGDLSVVDDRVSQVEEALGGVDVLVNITGGPPPTPVTGLDLELWSTHFRSMVLSVIAITDRVLPGMRARGWGRVITSTSSGVIAPIPNLGLSNTLRSSLVAWNKTLSGEVARDGVTANIVVPGRIATRRIAQLDEKRATREGRTPVEVASDSAESIPMGRYGEPSEYADVVTFLASERAGYVTGTVVRVDGGHVQSL